MKRKEIILGVIGIIVIVVVAFFLANMIHDNHVKSINKEEDKKQEEVEEKEDKIEVNGVEINFKTYRVDSSFFLNVPDTFTMLDEATLKSKYNYNNRPELVFMSESDTEHVFVSTTNEDMTDDGLEAYLNNRVAGLTGMTVIDSGVYQKYDKTFARLVATDANTYYNMRFFTLDNKLVTVEFNCSVNTYEEWEKVANEIMDSICFNEDDIKKYSSD
ncbi:MAG TPA: hypothetical protein IAB38_01965 [Candidatus Onthousia excrementipullorum]|uniref:Uncharacterized protein n=1 Tax=Candidatus Onthousia excrementipullorum TaxID=2840884 RepID=A0A9D1J2W3_9FIRM|nr:hypothetical protein [Candidatus Onthousia excrementipullorum]